MEKNLTALQHEVEVTKKTAFDSVAIKTDEDLSRASDAIKQVIELRKRIEKEKQDYTKPAREIVKKANDIYNPFINECKNAEQVLKRQSTDYLVAQQKKREEKERQIAQKLADGKIKKPETALRHMEKLPEAPKAATGQESSLRLRKVKKLKLEDESKLPREFLIPDLTKIKKALEAGIEVPGAVLIEEVQASSYGS